MTGFCRRRASLCPAEESTNPMREPFAILFLRKHWRKGKPPPCGGRAVPLSKNFYFINSAAREAAGWPLSRVRSHRLLHVDLRHPYRVFWVNQLVYNRPINKEYIFFRVVPSLINPNKSLSRKAYSKSVFNADIDQDVFSRHSSDFFNFQKGSPDR